MTRAPFHRWLRATVSPNQIAYAATEPAALEAAVRQGAGIGFVAAYRATEDPGLVEVLPPRPEWEAQLRIVTHVDLHRTRKVQAFLTHLKESTKSWKFCDGG
jgi:DNA-binding transcriptional LysR family regulator